MPAERLKEAEERRDSFIRWCRQDDYQRAAETLKRDWDRMVIFHRFPKEHWKHLRTANPVELPFAALRLRTDVAKRYKKVENAAAVIWKMLLVVEQRFRRLDASERMKQVFLGVQFQNGVEVKREEVLVVA